MPQVAVLSHHQPVGCRASTFVPRDVADLLVQRMAAERLSSKVIRMMAPDSVFLPAVQFVLPEVRYVPPKFSFGEIGRCRFVPPRDNNWNAEHRQAMNSLRVRAHLAMRAFRANSKDLGLSA